MELRRNADLRPLNSFGVSARARLLARVESIDDLRRCVELPAFRALPRLVLGSGSNILFTDNFEGFVLQASLRGRGVLGQDDEAIYIRAAAGESWHGLVRWSLDLDAGGLENLSLIPGSVGAAPIQNIGAYGVELSDRLHAVEALDLASGEMQRLRSSDCELQYRSSAFKSGRLANHLVTAVEFRLPRHATPVLSYPGVRTALGSQSESASPRQVSDAICALRRHKLPDPAILGNAGSFFHNPIVDRNTLEGLRTEWPELPAYALNGDRYKVAAAWLIERCGWKGRRQGDAAVSARHALVLVNHGAATGAEIWALAQAIRDSVAARFGLVLSPEPLII